MHAVCVCVCVVECTSVWNTMLDPMKSGVNGPHGHPDKTITLVSERMFSGGVRGFSEVVLKNRPMC